MPRTRGGDEPQRPWAALDSLGIRPSRGRGQNFLVQKSTAAKIVAAAQLSEDDEVVEIGPGLGILTDQILASPIRRLVLVEVEPGLASRLRERLRSFAHVEVIEGDVLTLDFKQIIERRLVKILGNLPFNTAAAILKRLGEQRELISGMTLMFQREVGERIRARVGEPAYGALSVFTSLSWEIERHFRVAAGSFFPRPKVDAEVVCFARQQKLLPGALEALTVEVIRASFSSRRKTLRNALADALGGKEKAETALRAAGIDPGYRAEQLDRDRFIRLGRESVGLGLIGTGPSLTEK